MNGGTKVELVHGQIPYFGRFQGSTPPPAPPEHIQHHIYTYIYIYKYIIYIYYIYILYHTTETKSQEKVTKDFEKKEQIAIWQTWSNAPRKWKSSDYHFALFSNLS